MDRFVKHRSCHGEAQYDDSPEPDDEHVAPTNPCAAQRTAFRRYRTRQQRHGDSGGQVSRTRFQETHTQQ